MLFVSMLIMGLVIGFIGIGGAGITIALLTVGFNVPIHTALAVALSAMVFTTMSGAYSHFKEGNVIPKTGAVLGISGMIGAFMGANFSNIIPSDILGKMSGSIMVLSAILLYIKVYQPQWLNRHFPPRDGLLEGNKLYIYGTIAGCINGFISGASMASNSGASIVSDSSTSRDSSNSSSRSSICSNALVFDSVASALLSLLTATVSPSLETATISRSILSSAILSCLACCTSTASSVATFETEEVSFFGDTTGFIGLRAVLAIFI